MFHKRTELSQHRIRKVEMDDKDPKHPLLPERTQAQHTVILTFKGYWGHFDLEKFKKLYEDTTSKTIPQIVLMVQPIS